MKRIFTFIAAVLLTATIKVNAQSPEKMSCQAVVRDANNDLVKDTQIGMQISIMQTTANGTAVYVETQMPTTNANGLATVEIGGGTVVSGNFSTIDWSAGPYFIKTETDVDNDGTYDITGTSQLLSVPYALYAKTAGDVTETDLGDILTNGNDGNGAQIKNIADPTDAQDAATKAYVDEVKQMVLQMNAEDGVMDVDANHYDAVVFGNQIWMAQNLKVTHYPNGDPIPNVTDNSAWANLVDNNTDDAYCYYNNNSGNEADTYGVLYTYAAAIADDWTKDKVENQGICPDGWHLPTDIEWKQLEMFLGMSQSSADDMNWRGTNEGSKLAGNEPLWTNGALDSNAEFGVSDFVGLPGGHRRQASGVYSGLGGTSHWWSATEGSNSTAYYRHLNKDNSGVHRLAYDKSIGFSVRCVKD